MRTDPSDNGDADIRMAYHSIAQDGTLNWLLLSYGKWAGGLKLFAAGSQGLSELKKNVSDDNVYFAFCRETVAGAYYYVTIAYIPEGVSGLRRTRAISTTRTVQSWFKASQAMLTLSTLDDLTTETIIRATRAKQLSDAPATSEPMARSSSDHFGTHKSLPPRPPEDSVRRSQSTDSDKRSPSPGPNRFRPLADFGDPAERAKRRQELLLRQMAAEEIAAKEEELRQARIKREKAAVLKRHEEEERKRREALEEELKRAAMLKAEKEEEERLAAELRVTERELKKRVDAEKRLASSQRIEAWRREEQQRLEGLVRQEEEALRQVEVAKQMSRATALQLRAERLHGEDSILHRGWVTIQNAGSLVWRRRWFELNSTSMTLYKSDKDLGKVLGTIKLTGCIEGVNEWNDGFEELRAIPHSFAIIFRGDQEPLSAYTDTAKDKADLAGFLLTYV